MFFNIRAGEPVTREHVEWFKHVNRELAYFRNMVGSGTISVNHGGGGPVIHFSGFPPDFPILSHLTVNATFELDLESVNYCHVLILDLDVSPGDTVDLGSITLPRDSSKPHLLWIHVKTTAAGATLRLLDNTTTGGSGFVLQLPGSQDVVLGDGDGFGLVWDPTDDFWRAIDTEPANLARVQELVTWSTDQNEYTVSTPAVTRWLLANVTAPVDLHGIDAGQTSITIPEVTFTLRLINRGTDPLTLHHDSTTCSTATSRFFLPNATDLVLDQYEGVELVWNNTDERWLTADDVSEGDGGVGDSGTLCDGSVVENGLITEIGEDCGGNTPEWIGPINILATDFTAPAAAQDIEIHTLGARQIIQAVAYRVQTVFSGGGVSDYTISLGIASNFTKYLSAVSMLASTQTYSSVGGHTIESFSGTTSIRARAVANVNVDNVNTGLFEVWLLIGELGS